MPTRFAVDQPVRAPRDAVLDALCDPAFYRMLGELPAIEAPSVLDRRSAGDEVHLRLHYRLSAELPPGATRFVDPAKLTWTDDAIIDRPSYSGRSGIAPDHYPKLFRAEVIWRLEEAADGTTIQHMEGAISARIPVVGRLVERGIVRGLTEHLAHEARLLERWTREGGGSSGTRGTADSGQ